MFYVYKTSYDVDINNSITYKNTQLTTKDRTKGPKFQLSNERWVTCVVNFEFGG